MKIYTVHYMYPTYDEDTFFVGAYSTRALAEAAVKQHMKEEQGDGEGYTITEVDVDVYVCVKVV